MKKMIEENGTSLEGSNFTGNVVIDFRLWHKLCVCVGTPVSIYMSICAILYVQGWKGMREEHKNITNVLCLIDKIVSVVWIAQVAAYILEIVRFVIGPIYYKTYCAIEIGSIICMYISYYSVYWTMWYRCYVLCKNKTLLQKKSRVFKAMSLFSLTIFTCSVAATLTIFIMTELPQVLKRRMMRESTANDIRLRTIKFLILACFNFGFQMIFLSLFTLPIIVHKRSTESNIKNTKIILVLKKICITTVLCVITDVSTIVFIAFLGKYLGDKAPFLLSVDLIVNALLLISTFNNMGERFGLVLCKNIFKKLFSDYFSSKQLKNDKLSNPNVRTISVKFY